MNTITTTMAFQGIEFKPLRRENQTWLRLPQIEAALGYASKGTSLARIYSRHADEFTKHMTKVIKVSTAGGKQAVRIFSLRGAHLLAMFARTDLAKAFRAWVLDVLDAEVERQNATVGTAGLVEFHKIMSRRVVECVSVIPDPMNRGAAISAAHTQMELALVSRFGVHDATKIPAQQFDLACDFLQSTPVSWEVVDEVPAGRYHFPMESAKPVIRNVSSTMTPKVLLEVKNPAPEMDLLDQLSADGHDVSGARIRILAMRQGLKYLEEMRAKVMRWERSMASFSEEMSQASRECGKPVMFDRMPNAADPIDRHVYASQLSLEGGK